MNVDRPTCYTQGDEDPFSGETVMATRDNAITSRQIRAGRVLAGLGVRELARLASVSVTSLNKIETGKTETPHAHTLERIESALRGVDIEFGRGGWVRHRDDHVQDAGQSTDEQLLDSFPIDEAVQFLRNLARLLERLRTARISP